MVFCCLDQSVKDALRTKTGTLIDGNYLITIRRGKPLKNEIQSLGNRRTDKFEFERDKRRQKGLIMCHVEDTTRQ